VTTSQVSAAPEENPPGAVRARRTGAIVWSCVGALAAAVVVAFAAVRAKSARIAAERSAAQARPKPPVEVVLREVAPREIVDRVRLPGVFAAREEVWVSAQVKGTVTAVAVAEGDELAAGVVICRIDDRDYRAAVEQAKAALEGASASRDLAAIQLERTRRLRADGAAGQAEEDAAEAAWRGAVAAVEQARAALARAELALERTVVRAPGPGVVSRLPVRLGGLVSDGTPVARLVDISRLKLSVGIPERDVAAVRGLREAAFTVDALGGRAFRGKVVRLGVETESGARVYPLELEVDNSERLLRPGMFATVDVVRRVKPDALVVPLFAVVARGTKEKSVMVEVAGRASRRDVELGAFLDAEVEITKGLSPGDRVIVFGQRDLDDGDPVRPVEPSDRLRELLP